MYAVFDGHGGSIASEFAKTYMADYISNSLEKSDDNKLEAVLKEAFIDLNNALTRHLKYDHSGMLTDHSYECIVVSLLSVFFF